MSVYDFKYKTIIGKEVKLEDYRGKVLLIVNIASKCGFTPQLEELQAVYEKYQPEGLEILGFPCNQFALQSPENNEQMNEFCKFNYGVTFPLSEKAEVIGENAHPLYEYLISQAPFQGFDMNNSSDKILHAIISEQMPENVVGDDVKWNFTKFLVGVSEDKIKRFEPNVTPFEMVGEIETMLKTK